MAKHIIDPTIYINNETPLVVGNFKTVQFVLNNFYRNYKFEGVSTFRVTSMVLMDPTPLLSKIVDCSHLSTFEFDQRLPLDLKPYMWNSLSYRPSISTLTELNLKGLRIIDRFVPNFNKLSGHLKKGRSLMSLIPFVNGIV